MAKKLDNAASTSSPNTLKLPADSSKSPERKLAEISLSPIVSNAQTARLYSKGTFGELDLTETAGVIHEQVAKVADGNMSPAERMLVSQAVTLNAMFTELARRAALNMGEYPQAMDIYLRQAFKAQAQCRATLEALAEIKNPRQVTFAKQANIANGPQQVNNGAPPALDTPAPARTGNSTEQANELLESDHGERLDTRAASTASGTHPAMETVAAGHRAKD